MFNFIIHLVFMSSIISLCASEALTHLKEPRSFPCPNEANIAPCLCIYDSVNSRLTLDCTDITSDEELAIIFTKEFPLNEFYEFRMNSTSVVTSLNFTCGGVKFQRFYLFPGSFRSLVEVSDVFYESCSNPDLEFVQLFNTQLSSLPFPPPPLSDKISTFYISYSNLASVPFIRSKSLSSLALESSKISEITPGTFDDIPKLRILYLSGNNIKILESGSIPITKNGFLYSLQSNKLETIEAGAFAFKGEPQLNSLVIHLSHNFLKTIDFSVFGLMMPYISRLNINDNPLDCGCDLAWIILNPEYLAKVTNYGDPTCADGQLLTELDPSPFEAFC